MARICDSEKKDIIIVTHGCALGYIIAWWMNFESQMLAKVYFSAAPGSISLLQENNYQQHSLKVLNDVSHLSELK
jgi:broad specificity phosphatase PhoE